MVLNQLLETGVMDRFSKYKSDLSSYYYLFKEKQWNDLRSFFYTKHLSPTGEGSQRWLFNPFIKPFALRMPNKFSIPKTIEVETTTLCNKKCIMCEYTHWNKGDQEQRHLSFDEFKYIVDLFPKLRWVNMTGEGSAFLNPDYPEMLRYMHDVKKASVWLVDHLDDIDFEFYKKEILPYVHGIYISMDASTKETYESIKVGCSYDNVIENLRKIICYKIQNHTPFPHLTFRFVMMKQNISEVPDFVDLINSIASPELWGGSSSRIEFTGLLSFPGIKQFEVSEVPSDILDELKKRQNNGGIRFVFEHPEQKRNPPAHRCTAWLEPYVMLPGYVLPCCAVLMSNQRKHLRDCSFGNLFETDIGDIWNGDKYKVFRKNLVNPKAPLPEICLGCRTFQTIERAGRYGTWEMS